MLKVVSKINVVASSEKYFFKKCNERSVRNGEPFKKLKLAFRKNIYANFIPRSLSKQDSSKFSEHKIIVFR